MHILSIFPTLLSFGLVAPALLRLTVGICVLLAGWERFKKPYKWASVAYGVVGVLIILGLYTQPTALVGIILVGFNMWAEKKISPLSGEQKLLHIFTVVVLLSLIFTGPGFLALDMPL